MYIFRYFYNIIICSKKKKKKFTYSFISEESFQLFWLRCPSPILPLNLISGILITYISLTHNPLYYMPHIFSVFLFHSYFQNFTKLILLILLPLSLPYIKIVLYNSIYSLLFYLLWKTLL